MGAGERLCRPRADAVRGQPAGQTGLFGKVINELCTRLARECRIRDVPWKRVQHAVAEDPRGIVLKT